MKQKSYLGILLSGIVFLMLSGMASANETDANAEAFQDMLQAATEDDC